jgi:CRISPR-associated endonuclease/helicase Cas3
LGHCIDVAACAFTIIEFNKILRARFAQAMGVDHAAVAPTMAALCSIHDIGKFDTRFQRKVPVIADRLRPHTVGIGTQHYDHGTEGFRQIEDDEQASAHLVTRLGPCALTLLRAVCGHHGAFPSRDDPDPSRCLLPRTVKREDERARSQFLDCVVDHFESLGAEFPCLHAVSGPFVQRLGGLCAISDWLGSNTDYFSYQLQPLDDLSIYWKAAVTRAQTACDHAGLTRSVASQVTFGDLFPGYTPRNVQLLTERVNLTEPALVIVEAAMGQGKTEAAVSIASRLLGQGVAEGLMFALPTMATSNAMFGRVTEAIPHLYPSKSVQLTLAHGRASRQPGFQEVIARGLCPRDDDAPEANVICSRWFLSSKRALLAQVGVGTIDQSLQAALNVRHQFVRMFGLSRNVIIIDEVHAYDAYMEVLLEHLLRWLGALEVPVLLLSATLPSHRRTALALAWTGRVTPANANEANELPASDDLATAASKAYPLVTVITRGSTQTHSSDDPPISRAISLEALTRSESDASHCRLAAARLVKSARAGGRVVWIRNTVREAQEAFRAVAAEAGDAIEHILFHSRFRGCDRAKIETTVLERFGKNAPAGGRILVATQVVEQSLDLDFDEMHSDLAPVDLLLQRVGRLQRHSRTRDVEFTTPRLIVHFPTEEDSIALKFGPSAYVYDVGTLWIAYQTLRIRKEIRLPEDIRALVEETYHPESRGALLSRGGPRLEAAETARESVLEARRTKARRCCIPAATVEPDGLEAMSDDDDTVMAFTRDGVSVSLLIFSWDGVSGRSLDSDESQKTWVLDANGHDAWSLASELSDQVLSIPARGKTEGLVQLEEQDAWNAWQNQFERFAKHSGIGARVTPIPMKRHTDGSYRGWLKMTGKKRRVLYTQTRGLVLPSEKDEAEAR